MRKPLALGFLYAEGLDSRLRVDKFATRTARLLRLMMVLLCDPRERIPCEDFDDVNVWVDPRTFNRLRHELNRLWIERRRRPLFIIVDENVAKEILGGRIFETDNPNAFIEWAPIFDFGIIAQDNLKPVDATDDPARNVTAKAIIAAITDHQLWSRAKAFKVTLYDGGASILEDLD